MGIAGSDFLRLKPLGPWNRGVLMKLDFDIRYSTRCAVGIALFKTIGKWWFNGI